MLYRVQVQTNNLIKWLEFDHTDKWYMPKPESVIEDKTHKILWDFEIQMDHPI